MNTQKGLDYTCPDNRLHDYEKQLVNNEEIVVEQCIRCGWKIYFNKRNSRIDTKRYAETHRLWFLQPFDPEFKENYGEFIPPKVDKFKGKGLAERTAMIEEEINQGMKELRREVILPKGKL